MADALLVGGEVGPQMSDPVTVCFCGLVGMEKLVATLTPSQVLTQYMYKVFGILCSFRHLHSTTWRKLLWDLSNNTKWYFYSQ